MNPDSLANYKLKVYNPGSPNPCPQTETFKSFPSVSTNPENPLKLTFSNRKRSRNTDIENSENSTSPKKLKMMKEVDVKALFEEIKADNEKHMESLKDNYAKAFAEEQAKTNSQTTSQLATIQTQLATIIDTQKTSENKAVSDKAETDARFKALEDRFEILEKAKNDERNPDVNDLAIENVVKNYVGNVSDPTWKANLAKEVFEAEHGIIIHGIRLNGADDEARKNFIKTFLKDDMKASIDTINKVRIKEVSRLGSDNGAAKPPPILVKFGHPTERNLILPLSSNLKEGIDVDKNVPKIYQKKHREFKRHAWKIKLLYNVKSQVVFDGCKLIVRYKKNDEGQTQYNWVTDKEWLPEPSDLEAVLSITSSRDPNKHDTPVIDMTSGSSECNKTIIATGLKDTVTRENLNEQVKNFIDENDLHLIQDIKFKSKSVALIICKDWSGSSYIAKKYNKKELLGKPVFLTMFNETDPDK